jgi:flagellar hook-associated protein 3 FlgL
MITRVADQMKFDLLNNSISSIQNDYNELMVEMSTQKKVNEPSDDPVGMGKILDYRSAKAQISYYQKNVDNSNSWLSTTESNLSSVNDILNQVKETAIAQSTATANASTRQVAADSLQPLIDQVLSLANAKFGNSYIFSGTRTYADTDTEPFSATAQGARIDAPVIASGDAYTGTVSLDAGASYTGTTNNTYVVKIVTGELPLNTTTYQVSSDGGKTWGAVNTDLSGTVDLGDGVKVDFTGGGGTFAANDIFSVRAYAPGYYNGNGEERSSEVGTGVTVNYSITGEEAFKDIFQTLNNLKTALQNNDATGIANQLNPLTEAQDQINRYIGQCGTRTNSLTISSSTLSDMDTRITGLTSNIEDADLAKLSTDYQYKQVALEACYKMASDLTSISILNFIR